jgi:hypothetical protein
MIPFFQNGNISNDRRKYPTGGNHGRYNFVVEPFVKEWSADSQVPVDGQT